MSSVTSLNHANCALSKGIFRGSATQPSITTQQATKKSRQAWLVKKVSHAASSPTQALKNSPVSVRNSNSGEGTMVAEAGSTVRVLISWRNFSLGILTTSSLRKRACGKCERSGICTGDKSVRRWSERGRLTESCRASYTESLSGNIFIRRSLQRRSTRRLAPA